MITNTKEYAGKYLSANNRIDSYSKLNFRTSI